MGGGLEECTRAKSRTLEGSLLNKEYRKNTKEEAQKKLSAQKVEPSPILLGRPMLLCCIVRNIDPAHSITLSHARRPRTQFLYQVGTNTMHTPCKMQNRCDVYVTIYKIERGEDACIWLGKGSEPNVLMSGLFVYGLLLLLFRFGCTWLLYLPGTRSCDMACQR